jgi:hypothetical protein
MPLTMDIVDLAERACERAHLVRREAVHYDIRKREGRATKQKAIMIRRRIAQLRELLSVIEDRIAEEREQML